MTTNTNELLGTEELELVSGGWFALAMRTASSVLSLVKDASSQYKELPAGWGTGLPTVPHDPAGHPI
jgi:hypothetical protein